MELNKIRLRPLQEKDAARMLEWLRNEDVTKFLTINGSSMTLNDALCFIKKAGDESVDLHRAIVDENDNYLGTVSLKNINKDEASAEYAITLHPSAMGTGAAGAASEMIAKLAFEELFLSRVYLNVLKINKRAVRLYEKQGYRYTHSSSTDFGGDELELLWFEIDKRGE